MNHYSLFSSLLTTVLPPVIVDNLSNWYSMLFVTVYWHGNSPNILYVGSGACQGSVLLPVLFKVFIDLLICHLKHSASD
jgi:hypothetical protein